MAATTDRDTWKELMRECPVIPLDAEGREMPAESLSPGNQLAVREERGDQLVVEGRGVTPAREWRYLVRREDFLRALTPPEGMPRSGQAPTAPATTAGGPD